MSTPPEVWEPEARARALEAIRRRLDDATPMAARVWPMLARELGYASGDACKRACWRLANRLANNPHLALYVVRLARSVNLPADGQRIRRALRELDQLHMPGDRDPPKPTPRKWRPMSDAAIRRLAKQLMAEAARTVDGNANSTANNATPGATRRLPAPMHDMEHTTWNTKHSRQRATIPGNAGEAGAGPAKQACGEAHRARAVEHCARQRP